RMAGVCMGNAANGVIEKSRQIAAHMLKVDPKDVEFSGGPFRPRGCGAAIGICDVARAAQELNDLDDTLRGPLAAESDVSFTAGGYPYWRAGGEGGVGTATRGA